MSKSDWTEAHVAELQRRITALTGVAAGGRGKDAAKRAAEASAEAERLEKRLARMMRLAGQHDLAAQRAAAQAERAAAQAARVEAQARRAATRLARSKNAADRAELVLGAIDELPIDLALTVAEEAFRRTRARAGDPETHS